MWCDQKTFFFFNDTATTEIYTLSLHDALPISRKRLEVETFIRFQHDDTVHRRMLHHTVHQAKHLIAPIDKERVDRKSTRLNSSHANISYAVFCLKKKT